MRTPLRLALPSLLRVYLTGACLLTLSRPAGAHEGPPFPIIVDEPVGTMRVSVWTDPDIGTGTFFVVLEPVDGAAVPEDMRVEIGVWPVSERLEEVRYPAEPQRVRYGARYYAEVAFDRGEWWHVRIVLQDAEGRRELTAQVEATPDGTIGPISLLVYLLPFIAVGLLWLKAVLHQRRSPPVDDPA